MARAEEVEPPIVRYVPPEGVEGIDSSCEEPGDI